MEIGNIIPHIESLIFASEKPLTSMEITELINNAFGFMEDKLTLEQIQTAIDGIVEKYRSEFYPFEIRESGGGWQFLTKKEFHKTVAQLNGDKFLKRLSAAALETLAIIAYKQPVTKAEIEAIRGVSSDYAIQKLLEKELVTITGRNEKLPGHPLVYATSKNFMDYFGLNSPDDLPKLKEIFDESIVDPTAVNAQAQQEAGEPLTEEEQANLVVRENGELAEAEEPDADVADTTETNDMDDMAATVDPYEETGETFASEDPYDEEPSVTAEEEEEELTDAGTDDTDEDLATYEEEDEEELDNGLPEEDIEIIDSFPASAEEDEATEAVDTDGEDDDAATEEEDDEEGESDMDIEMEENFELDIEEDEDDDTIDPDIEEDGEDSLEDDGEEKKD